MSNNWRICGKQANDIEQKQRHAKKLRRLDLVEDIWDSIAEVPVPEAQRQELDRRLAAHRENPTNGATWTEVKRRTVAI